MWVESGLFGQGTVELVLAGKDYNKAMRAHKLTLQALWRLLMPNVLSHIEDVDTDCHGFLSSLSDDDNLTNVERLLKSENIDKLRTFVEDFIASKSNDANLCFWWQYMNMVSILLHFTRVSPSSCFQSDVALLQTV